jgi:hypothetical protein
LSFYEQGFLNASQQCATEVVLPSLYVRLESPNALGRLFGTQVNTCFSSGLHLSIAPLNRLGALLVVAISKCLEPVDTFILTQSRQAKDGVLDPIF